MGRRRELAALGELQREVWGSEVQRRYRAAQRRSRARRFGFAVVAFGVTLVALGIASPGAHATPPRPLHKITLCHRTDSYLNPYVVITVDVASTLFEGHDGHNGPVFFPSIAKHVKWGDIIPPFNFGGSLHYAGKNWTDAGISIFNNRCALPSSAHATTTVSAATTVPPTTYPSPSTSTPVPSTTTPRVASTTTPSPSTTSGAPPSSTTVGSVTTVPSSVTTAGGQVTTTVTLAVVTTTSPPSGISTFQVPTTTSTSSGGPL